MKVLGFGTANLTVVPVDGHMRLDTAALREQVRATLEEKIPVLAVIGVLGTTEFGTIDPIHEILAVREECRKEGHDFGIHVDAAWGGYLTAMFREPDGSFCERATLQESFRHFPTESVYGAFRGLSQVDSITVDPHKMGYVPYSAGAFVARDRRVVDFITQQAAYVFDLGGSEVDTPMGEKLRNLGQYILEGSKPGAGAASVYITHKVLPLHREGFGRLLSQTVHACEYFYDKLNALAEELQDRVRISMPFEPDTNLVCLLFNPTGNTSLARLNEYARSVFSHMKVDPSQPLQIKRFIASYTSLQPDRLPRQESERVLNEVGIDPATFGNGLPAAGASDHIFILRHTLMNPWLQTERNGGNYIDEYLAYLRELLLDTLDSHTPTGSRAPA